MIRFKNKIKAISLFSNVGIAETYFADVGIEVVVANELVDKRARFYKHLYPNVNMICGDITDKDVFDSVINEVVNKKVDMLIATPPCQGMSCAGRKDPKDPKDPRNFLIFYAVEAIKKIKPKAILILGTSDKMVKTIAENLGLPEIQKTIYITDVATEEEIENAKRIRTTEGKHVIPVPTFELKKDFSGYLLDPLQIFKSQGLNGNPYIAEKSIIRPTFNYIGNFTISDNVFKQIIEVQAKGTKSISRIIRVIVNKSEEGPNIYIEVEIVYGFNIMTELKKFKERCINEIERQTTMNVAGFKIIARKISLPVIGEIPNIEDITKEID